MFLLSVYRANSRKIENEIVVPPALAKIETDDIEANEIKKIRPKKLRRKVFKLR